MNTSKKIKTYIRSLTICLLCMCFLYTANSYQLLYSENASVYTISKLGSRGDEVRKIQKKLKELGYYKDSVDGIYGTGTKKAVTAFQKSCGITADGIAGPLFTRAVLALQKDKGAVSDGEITARNLTWRILLGMTGG